jgi:hypothetical protein
MSDQLTNISMRLTAASTLLAQANGVTGKSCDDLLAACRTVLRGVNEDILNLTPVALDANFASSPIWKQIVRLTAIQGRLDTMLKQRAVAGLIAAAG